MRTAVTRSIPRNCAVRRLPWSSARPVALSRLTTTEASSGAAQFPCRGMSSSSTKEGFARSGIDKDSENNNDTQQPKPQRRQILDAALTQVREYGWTQDAIVAGVQQLYKKKENNNDNAPSLALAGTVTPQDLIRHCMEQFNQRLRRDLNQQRRLWDESQATRMDRIVYALKLRLEYLDDMVQCKRWHEGMALGLANPYEAWATSEQLRDLIDIVLEAAWNTNTGDDNSSQPPQPLTEIQRMGLGAVYVATELHLLTDPSPDYQETWEFLRERVQDWERLAVNMDSSSSSGVWQRGSDAAFVTTAVASSLASGALSLLQINNPINHSNSHTMALWNTLMQTAASATPFAPSSSSPSARAPDGTKASDYDVGAGSQRVP